MTDSPTHELIDIGVNLAHKRFRADLEQVLARARAAGVTRFIATGTSVEASREAHALTLRYPGEVFCTAGVHPHNAKQFDHRTLPALRSLAAHASVVTLGECGLDYDRDFSPRPVQRECFHAQLALARELQRPVFLHERAATDDFLAMLREHAAAKLPMVVHCFTGQAHALEAYLALGAHIGITGWICDDRRGAHLRDLLRIIPEDRLMLETDAPFLLPPSLRPQRKDGRNEPAHLSHVLTTVARALDRTPAEVAAQTTANACRFFWGDDALGSAARQTVTALSP